jgi:uncharacterized protein (TIRG00374 family)
MTGLPEEPPHPETHARRRRLILVLRLVLSAGLIAYLVSRIPHGRGIPIWPGWSKHTVFWLGGAFVLVVGSIVLSVGRWHEAVRAVGLVSSLRRLGSIYLAGLFVGNVLPSTIGGDVLRVSRLSKDTGDSASSFASVVLERLSGWVALPVLSLIGLSVNPGLRSLGTATTLAVATSLITLGLLVVLVIAAGHPKIGGRLAERDDWRRFLGAIHLGVDKFRRHPVSALRLLAASFVYQFVLVVAAHMIANAIDFDFGFTAILAFVPIVTIIQVLPISIAGLGVREALYVYFFHTALNEPTEKALALSLLLYGLNLVASLLGVPAFLVQRKQPKTA